MNKKYLGFVAIGIGIWFMLAAFWSTLSFEPTTAAMQEAKSASPKFTIGVILVLVGLMLLVISLLNRKRK